MLFYITCISLLRCAVCKGNLLTLIVDAYHFQFILMKLLTENLAAVAVWLGHIKKKIIPISLKPRSFLR